MIIFTRVADFKKRNFVISNEPYMRKILNNLHMVFVMFFTRFIFDARPIMFVFFFLATTKNTDTLDTTILNRRLPSFIHFTWGVY